MNMKSIRNLIAIAAVMVTACTTTAADGSMKDIVNSFIATYAKTNIAWQKNVLLGIDPSNLAPGTQLGLSKVVGYYSFEPKTWDDLSSAERNEMLSDARLGAFVISLRNATQPPPGRDGQVPIGENGRPMFPVSGLSLDRIASGSSLVDARLRKKQVVIDLSAEQLVNKSDIQVKTFK